MTKHTPGPWKVAEGVDVMTALGYAIHTHPDYSSIDDEDEIMANARLIAAAPDLLQALWAMVTSFHAVEWMEPHMRESADMARAAIAKAEVA